MEFWGVVLALAISGRQANLVYFLVFLFICVPWLYFGVLKNYCFAEKATYIRNGVF
jgi:hypothetical protein